MYGRQQDGEEAKRQIAKEEVRPLVTTADVPPHLAERHSCQEMSSRSYQGAIQGHIYKEGSKRWSKYNRPVSKITLKSVEHGRSSENAPRDIRTVEQSSHQRDLTSKLTQVKGAGESEEAGNVWGEDERSSEQDGE